MHLHVESTSIVDKPKVQVVLDADEGLPTDGQVIRDLLLAAVLRVPNRTSQMEVIRLETKTRRGK